MSKLQRKQLQMLLKKQNSLQGLSANQRRGVSEENKPQTQFQSIRKDARHSEMIDPSLFQDKLLNIKNTQISFPNTLQLKSLKLNSHMLPSSRSGSSGKEPYSMVSLIDIQPIYSPKPRQQQGLDTEIASQDDNLSIVTGSSRLSQAVTTVMDLQKKGKYYELGGLGPNLGTEAHRKAKAKLETINEYSKYIRKTNLKRNKSNTTLTKNKLQEEKEALKESNYESVV